MRLVRSLLSLLAAGTLCLPAALAHEESGQEPPGQARSVLNIQDEIQQRIGFDQKMDAQVPLDIPFQDESGQTVRLGDFTGTRPLLVALVYYGCPHLCKLQINGIVQSLQETAFNVGSEFEVAVVSIDPKDTPKIAAQKRKFFLTAYNRPKTEKGFHFLVGEEPNIQKLASAVGFKYFYDKRSKEFAHPAGVVILTPQGRVSRYLFGTEFASRDLRLALVEAANEKIGTPLDRILLYCYHYDPVGGKYGLIVTRALRLAGAATVVFLGLGVGMMLWRERRKKNPVDSRVNP